MAVTNDLIPDFDDFERYYSGQMPAGEQRALEGRMLDEPLVADAYEGFLAWRGAHTDVASVRTDLHNRLHERVARERKPELPLWAYASAASVLLVLFTYWTFFLRENRVVVKENTMAVSRPEKAQPARVPMAEPDKAADKFAKTAQPLKAPLSANPKPAEGATGREEAGDESVQPAESLMKSDAATALAEAEVKQEQVTVPASAPELLPTPASQPVPETVNKLAASETLQAVGKSMAARAKATPSKPSFVSKKAADTVPGQGEVLSEVVVVGATQAKKTTSAYAFEPDRPAPVPVGGWEAYRVYINKNTDSSAVTGQITVTFIVNPTGVLSGIIARGPEELHKEAVRIISSGPAWAPARTKGMPVASHAEIQLQFRQGQ